MARRSTRPPGLAALLLLGLPFLLGTGPAVDAGTSEPLTLEVVSRTSAGPRLEEVVFRSPATDGGTAPVRLLLPDDYDPSGATRYPVLLLLHGGGGSQADWTEQGQAIEATAGLPLIVVMPSVTGHGNYVDWYNHGRGGPPQWETFVIDQLLPWVDANLPTIGARHGRAVAGLSMGGGGAIGYAALHPDLFVSAAAFSGAVDTNTGPVQLLAMTSGVDHGHEVGAVHGHRLTDEVRWRGRNPFDLAENLRGVDLVLATGNGLPGGPNGNQLDPVELACWQMMTNLHQRLTELGIAHQWDDYGAGSHAWWYWARELREYLPHVMDVFTASPPAAPPPAFTYRSIEPAFEAHGWDVRVDRPHVEFAALAVSGLGASDTRFGLHGTGAAVVTTPPVATPGQAVDVERTDADGTTVTRTQADGDGRVEVPVALGPANPYQQHTIEGRLWAGLAQPDGAWPVRSAEVVVRPVVTEPAAAAPATPSGTGVRAGAGAAVSASASATLPTTGGGAGSLAIGATAAAAAGLLRVLRRRR